MTRHKACTCQHIAMSLALLSVFSLLFLSVALAQNEITAGRQLRVIVRAVDKDGQVDSTATQTVSLTSSDPCAIIIPGTQLLDNGSATFLVTEPTPGPVRRLTAHDLTTSLATGRTDNLTVIDSTVGGPATHTWTGGGGSDNWSDSGNWTGGVPERGNDVVVNSTGDDIVIDSIENYLHSIMIGTGFSGTITFQNMAVCTNSAAIPTNANDALTVMGDFVISNGTLYIEGNTTVDSIPGTPAVDGRGKTINAANITIGGLASISAYSRGFPMQEGPGYGSPNGSASYGGKGGWSTGSTGPTYGSATAPVALGSGGSGWSGKGIGGGAIKLAAAGTLTVNGTVTADAEDSSYYSGTGGSVWLISSNFTGSGVILARGAGAGGWITHSAPGGGRIAIEYDTSGFTGSLSVKSNQQPDTGAGQPGFPGSIHLDGVTFAHADRWCSNANSRTFRLYMPETVNGGGDVIVESDALFIPGTYEECITITNSIHAMLLAGTFSFPAIVVRTNAVLYCNGDIQADAIRGDDEQRGDEVPDGSGVTLTCSNMTVDMGGRITADVLGFQMDAGPGTGTTSQVGGSYGGKGGVGSGTAGDPYGSEAEPRSLGSGGSGYSSSDDKATGGGAMKLNVIDTLTVNGSITASGYVQSYYTGSGGSIWINADTVTGVGGIRANGGDGSRPGGGGRAALYADTTNGFTGTIEALQGQGGDPSGAEDGTVYKATLSSVPTDLIVTHDGDARTSVAESVTITARDYLGNVVTGYSPATTVSISATGSGVPSDASLEPSDFIGGVAQITVTDAVVEIIKVTATDDSDSSIDGTSVDLAVRYCSAISLKLAVRPLIAGTLILVR